MFQRFSEEARKVLKNAKKEMQNLKHPFVGSEHLILSILSLNSLDITKRLKDYQVTYDKFKQELIKVIGLGNSLNSYFIYTPLLKRIIETAIINSKESSLFEVTPNDLFLALIEEGEGVGIRILNNLNINIDELYNELEKKSELNRKYKNKRKLLIYDYSIDLVNEAKNGRIDPVIGRDTEINRLIEILLRKNKNNPLLIGEAGVGKTAIVEALALKISQKDVPENLMNKKILSISVANLVAGTKYRGEFEDRIEKIIKEIEENSNLIVFIDEIHLIVGAGGAEGAIDAASILKPSLARGKFKLIGATTLKEYKETIEKDKALNRRFQTLLVNEPNLEETKNILQKIKPIYEKYHGVLINNEMIEKIVVLSDKYIFERKNPDKAIDVLDEVCTRRSLIKDKDTQKLDILKNELIKIEASKNNFIINNDFKNASYLKQEQMIIEDKINKLSLTMNQKNKKEVLEEDISEIIKLKVNTPVYEIDKEDIKLLDTLEKKLKNRIIGQDNVISILCYETKKIKLGLKNSKKPTSFLFVGNSGVGKTELAKVYANELKMNLVRIDASEYKENHAISKIVGSPPGYVGYNDYSVLDEVKNHPYSVILIDEIEKASKSFLNLFLQILDEGFITNSNLEKIHFDHTIIIMTSNSNFPIASIGFNNQYHSNNLEGSFSREFLNRINNIITFNNLNDVDIKKIIKKEIKLIKDKIKIQGIDLVIKNNIIDDILSLSNYNEYGARKIKKIIEDKIDNIIIDNLLKGVKKINIKQIV